MKNLLSKILIIVILLLMMLLTIPIVTYADSCPMVTGGDSHTVVLKTNGTVWPGETIVLDNWEMVRFLTGLIRCRFKT